MRTLLALLAAVFCLAVVYAQCPDSNGDNGTFATATNISNCTTVQACFATTAKTEDFYKILAPSFSAATLYTTVLFEHDEGDLDIELLDLNGTEIDSSAATSDNETLVVSAAGGVYYYVKVFRFSKEVTPQTYNITTCFVDVCTDAYGSHFTTATAYDVAGVEADNVTLSPSYCGFDGYFNFTTTAARNITIRMVLNHDLGDLDMELLDSAGVSLDSSASTTNFEEIIYALPAAGEFTLRVYAFSSTERQPYSLSFAIEGAVGTTAAATAAATAGTTAAATESATTAAATTGATTAVVGTTAASTTARTTSTTSADSSASSLAVSFVALFAALLAFF